MSDLVLGLDLGTSGIRSAVLDADGNVLSMARATYGAGDGAEAWWQGAKDCLITQIAALRQAGIDPTRIARIATDGTSGSMVLTDGDVQAVSRPLMYNDGGFQAEADRIAALAPDPHITRGPNSSLARALRLLAEDTTGGALHLLHQADFIAAKLIGEPGLSDENNALKTGFDPATGRWPDWFAGLGLPKGLLPEVRPAGAEAGGIDRKLASELGFAADTRIHLGTTDSIAAFVAASAPEIGNAVTSLGSTLAVKLMSDRRIDAPEIGLYAHKLGDAWLVGGASNTGGRVLAEFFSGDELKALSDRIDPDQPCNLDYYPLLRPGERFPINDPDLPPRLTPRPQDDAEFLHGLLTSIARIEAQCYAAMRDLGAPEVKRITTAGGGASNPVWTAIRQQHFATPIANATHVEAAIGTARLILPS